MLARRAVLDGVNKAIITLNESLFAQVNAVLAQWNPIGVPEDTALDEYRSYVAVLVESWNRYQDAGPALVWASTRPMDYHRYPAFTQAAQQLATHVNRLLRAHDEA